MCNLKDDSAAVSALTAQRGCSIQLARSKCQRSPKGIEAVVAVEGMNYPLLPFPASAACQLEDCAAPLIGARARVSAAPGRRAVQLACRGDGQRDRGIIPICVIICERVQYPLGPSAIFASLQLKNDAAPEVAAATDTAKGGGAV